jgi:protein ImuB
LARGVRQRSLVLAQASSSFAEEMELDDAVEELEPLSFLLGRLLDQLCARLEARALAMHAVRIRFELQPSFEKDFQTLQENMRKKPEVKHYDKVLTLPVPMRNAKTLLKLLRLQLQGDPPGAPIQKIYMTAEAAAPRVAQNGLFVPCGPDPEKLEVTIARLAKLVGEGNLGYAELVDSHRPESFQMKRFVIAEQHKRFVRARLQPCRNTKEINKASAAEGSVFETESARVVSALRMLRPPESVRVDVKNEQPARVYLRGMRGEVVASSGPWRSSGDWWQEDPWHQDEWDLEIEFPASVVVAQHAAPVQLHKNNEQSQSDKQCSAAPQRGLYRIYFDALRQEWFLRGVYD